MRQQVVNGPGSDAMSGLGKYFGRLYLAGMQPLRPTASTRPACGYSCLAPATGAADGNT